MTKFTPEIPAQNSKPSKKTQAKKIILISLVMLFALSVIEGITTPDKEETTQETTTVFSSSVNTLPDNESPSPVQNKDTEIGVSCIKPAYTSLNLNETQKLLLDYFDNDSLSVSYDSLVNSTAFYKNSQVLFYGVVNEIINGTTALIEYGAYIGFDDVYYKSGKTALVKLDKNSSADIIGTTVNVYAVFKGTENYNGNSLPYFEAARITDYWGNYVESPKFSKAEAIKISQYFFGNKATVRQAQNSDFEFLEETFYEDLSSSYYVSEIKGLENKGFTKYGLSAVDGGMIIDCKTQESINRYITFSGDFKTIYVHTYDWDADIFTFECYDKSFNKIWSRQFTEGALVSMDYTSDCIYLCVKDTLYIIDSKNGENITEPKKIGEHHAIRKLEDGILLVASDENGVVTKTDLNGNVLWRKDLVSDSYDSKIQIVDGKYIIQFFSFDSYTDTIKTYVFKPDGTVEFSHQEN